MAITLTVQNETETRADINEAIALITAHPGRVTDDLIQRLECGIQGMQVIQVDDGSNPCRQTIRLQLPQQFHDLVAGLADG